ncbi:hypothetical protein HQ576_03850 [bacterium]|nr:hypothetical protein [bacterium]
MNTGEEICGEWLRHVKGCDFVEYNLAIPGTQGEIDVVGISLRERLLYTCEVAVHLPTGLWYQRERRPANVAILTEKFMRHIEYLRRYFEDYHHELMLWSPIVKSAGPRAQFNQVEDVAEIVRIVLAESGLTVTVIMNESYHGVLQELREIARRESRKLESSVMRYLQIEEHLSRHLGPTGG